MELVLMISRIDFNNFQKLLHRYGLFFFIFLSASQLNAEEIKFTPTQGRWLFIGQDQVSIESYIQDTGHIPDGFTVYTSIHELDGLTSPTDHGAGFQHAKYFADKYPAAALHLSVYMVGSLKSVLKGVHDGNIHKLAEWLKTFGKPVFLRIGYEFDLPENQYNPDDYRKAFRYIVGKLRKEKVTNAAYVWATAARENSKCNFNDWYPGDKYVDWFGFSMFDTPQIPVVEKFIALARKHQKPVMVAEAAPAGRMIPRSRKEWFERYFALIQKYDIKVASYINCDWDSFPMFKDMGWHDSRVQTDPEIKTLWLEELKKNGFLR